MMDGIGLSNLEIVTICSRMTLDAIGIAGFGKEVLYICT
jgi:hypothetical protein